MGAIVAFKRPEPVKPTPQATDEMFRYKLPDPKNELEAEIFHELEVAWKKHSQAAMTYYQLNNRYRDVVGMPRLGE